MHKVAARTIPTDVDGAIEFRMRASVRRDHTSGCWLWEGWRNRKGYGAMTIGQHKFFVHRLAYTYYVGRIPDGLVIDHLCRVRNCVNPDHLEAVTNAENVQRGKPQGQAHCAHGHEFTPENTRQRGTSRICIACSRRRVQEFRARKTAAA